MLADIARALSSGQVTNDGPTVRELERRVACHLGAGECVAVSSGSAALTLATAALGLTAGKVVLPAFTYIATLNAPVQAGLTPVFCDVEPDTWTMSPGHLDRILAQERDVRLVVPVNVFGVPPELAAIRDLAERAGAALLLDNAHGFGTAQRGVRCAPEPVLQTFSFHATKVLPAIEGGAVVTSDATLLAELRRLRNHGLDPNDLLASRPGYNAKLSELHAAVGLRSFQNFDGVLARRREYATRLRRVLARDCAPAFDLQHVPESIEPNFQNLGVLCRVEGGGAAMQAALAEEGIDTRRYFWPPLHDLPAYRGRFTLPVSDDIGGAILCLPLYSRMDEAVLERIESGLRRAARRLA
jgi:dTDP-4-amino-4,6-dideoxygalactose transaminase